MARFNHNTKEGAFQSTITVVREADSSDETPQEVQGIQGQTASLSLPTGVDQQWAICTSARILVLIVAEYSD